MSDLAERIANGREAERLLGDVLRLKARVAELEASRETWHKTACDTAADLAASRAREERLREAFAKIIARLSDYPPWGLIREDVEDIYRAALAEAGES